MASREGISDGTRRQTPGDVVDFEGASGPKPKLTLEQERVIRKRDAGEKLTEADLATLRLAFPEPEPNLLEPNLLEIDQEALSRELRTLGPGGALPGTFAQPSATRIAQQEAEAAFRFRQEQQEFAKIVKSNFSDVIGTTDVTVLPEAEFQPIIASFLQSVNTDPDGFLESVFQKGRTPDTEFILELFGFREEDIDEFFQGAPPGAASALEASIRNIFPGFTVDQTLDWINQTLAELNDVDPGARLAPDVALPGSDFFVTLKAIGLTTDTWNLMEILFPDMSKVDLVDFFKDAPTKSASGFLGKIGTAFEFAQGFWQVALMEMGFEFRKAIEFAMGDTSRRQTDAEKMLDASFEKYGWRAIYADETQQAWDFYFVERDVKGPAKFVAELANPLFFVPVGGTIGRLAIPLRRVPVLGETAQATAKVVQALEAAPVTIPVAGVKLLAKPAGSLARLVVGKKPAERFLMERLPTPAELKERMFRSDVFNAIAKHIPGMNKIAPATVIGDLPVTLATNGEIEAAVTQEVLMRVAIIDVGQGAKGQALASLRELGTTKKIYGMVDGFADPRLVKPLREGDSLALGDIVQAPEQYTFTHPRGLEYAKRAQGWTRDLFEIATVQEQIKIGEVGLEPFQEFVHWVVTGRIGKDGLLEAVRRGTRSVGGITPSQKARRFSTQAEGIAEGYVYADDLEVYVSTYYDDLFKAIADKRYGEGIADIVSRIDGIAPTGPLDRLNFYYPEVELAWQGVRKQMADLGYTLSHVKTAGRGDRLTGATMAAIQRRVPDIGERLDAAMALGETTIDREFKRFSDELWRELRITPVEFKAKIVELRGAAITGQNPVRAGEIDAALKNINADAKISVKMLKQIYQNTHSFRAQAMKDISADLTERIDKLRPRWLNTRHTRADRLTAVKSPLPGQGEGQIRTANGNIAPLFSNHVYPAAIAEQATKMMVNEASGVLKAAAIIGGSLRIPVASLDFSVATIQLLIGTLSNPTKGVPAILKGLQTLIRPSTFQRYLNANNASMQERIFYQGSQRPFEFFETFGWITKIGSKLPGGRLILGETYGRAQAAYSMTTTVFKDLMWQANSARFIRAGEGAGYARSLDRMTDSMSFAANGTPANLSAFLTGFVSFAPQYAVATASWFTQAFKGGIIGKQARIDLMKMVTAGVVAYSAFTRALGVETYLDPVGDGKKFMSIEIGGQWIGIGGRVISMLRAFADITASVASVGENEPLDFVTLDRWQNPVIRAWFTQSAILPQKALELATQRNFLGYPIESPSDWAGYAASFLTPIAFQDILPDKGGLTSTPLAVLGEFFGLRTSPESRWEALNDRLSKPQVLDAIPDLTEEQREDIEGGDTVLSIIDRFQKLAMFEAFPEHEPLYEQAIADNTLRESNTFKNYQNSIVLIRETAAEQLDEALSEGVQVAGEDTDWLRKRYGEIFNNYGTKNALIRQVEEYQPILDEFERNREERKEDATQVDLGYWNYIDDVISPDWTKPGGDFDFDAYNNAIELWRAEWGEDIYQKVLVILEDNKAGFPEWAIRLWKDRLALSEAEYWDLPYQQLRRMTQLDLDDDRVPEQYIDLVTTYLGLSAAEQRKLVEENNILSQDFRGEFRLANTELDAVLGFWDYGGEVQSRAAYDRVVEIAKELGIPLQQTGIALPPERHVDAFFEHNEVVAETSGGSQETKLFLLEHPEYLAFLVERDGRSDLSEENIDTLRLKIEHRDDFAFYDSISDRDSENFVQGTEAQRDARENYLKTHPLFRDNRRRIEIMDKGMDNRIIIEQFVKFRRLEDEHGSNSAEANLFKVDNQILFNFGNDPDTFDWQPIKEDRIPIWRIDVLWREQDEAFDEIASDTPKGRAARDAFLAGNEEYRKDRRRRQGLQDGVSVDLIERHVELYELPEAGFRRERWLLDHPEYYNSIWLNKEVLDNSRVDFDAIPDARYDAIREEWSEQFAELDAISEEVRLLVGEERRLARERLETAVLAANPGFLRAWLEARAYIEFLPSRISELNALSDFTFDLDTLVEGYVQYQVVRFAGRPEGWARWWQDDRALRDNPMYYEWRLAEGSRSIDFDAIPSVGFENAYNEIYINIRRDNGDADRARRLQYRLDNPGFDAEGVRAGLWLAARPTSSSGGVSRSELLLGG